MATEEDIPQNEDVKEVIDSAGSAVSRASAMAFAIGTLHQKLEDAVMARGDRDDQGMFEAMGACIRELDEALDKALHLLDRRLEVSHG